MSSSFCCESRDFSQAEKERTAGKVDQIYKRTTVSTQNDPRLSIWVKIVVILWIYTALQTVLSFSAREKSRDPTPNSQKLD